MKTAYALAALCLVSIHLCAQQVTLTGHIKGFTKKQILITYHLGRKDVKTDTVQVNDGQFTWKANLDEPQEVNLALPNMFYPVFVQSGHITVTGMVDSFSSFVVKGSKVQEEKDAYIQSMKDLDDQEKGLYSAYANATKEEQAVWQAKLDAIETERNQRADRYIASHPSSFISIELVATRGAYGRDYAQTKKAYDLLSEKAKRTASGKHAASILEELRRGRIGMQMINFIQHDTADAPVHYTDFKGKYVLVDFWASWCKPCRAENPNVLKAYQQYKDKGFTVIGISLDDKADHWKKAIRDDQMPWAQLSDLKGHNNEVSMYYGIQGIPSNLLVDPSGKIIAKDLLGDALHQKLAEIFH